MARGYRLGLRGCRQSDMPHGGESWAESKPEKKTLGDKMATVLISEVLSCGKGFRNTLWSPLSRTREIIVKCLKIMTVQK